MPGIDDLHKVRTYSTQGIEGNLIIDGVLIGASNKRSTIGNQDTSPLRITVSNIDMSRAVLYVNIGYRTADSFGVADIAFSEIGSSPNEAKLGIAIRSYIRSTKDIIGDLAIATKKIKGSQYSWEIIIGRYPGLDNRTIVQFNLTTVSYKLVSPEITNYFEVGETTLISSEFTLAFSDGTSPSTSDYEILQTSDYSALPVGSIVAWYPVDPKYYGNDSILTNPANAIADLTNGTWALCDGSNVNNGAGIVTTPDLRGRFIMGYGSKTKGKYMTGTGIHEGEFDGNPGVKDLGPYNSDSFRHETYTGTPTENISFNEVVVNCGKIGNLGGFYLTKLLPKQQGSLFMAAGSGCGDNSNDARSMNAVAFAYAKPTSPSVFTSYPWESTPVSKAIINNRNDSECYSDTSGFKEPNTLAKLFGTNNTQAFLGTKDNLKGKWGPMYNYARVLLGEGASPHDNKPPYIVMAYIIKIK